MGLFSRNDGYSDELSAALKRRRISWRLGPKSAKHVNWQLRSRRLRSGMCARSEKLWEH